MMNLSAGLAKIAGLLKIGAGVPAIAGAVLAATVGTYVVAPQVFRFSEQPAEQSAPAPAAGLVDSTVTAPETAPQEDAPATEVASAEPEPAQPSGVEEWAIPSFDLLRVEPDGSTVIAGKAEPGTTLNIMNGDTVIASTEVGPSGDFAAVFDEPLAPGDYQLSLQVVGKGGETLRSEEVATVSIPTDAGGELLAMVSKPGKASRIITQPEAPEPEKPVETASAEPTDPEAPADSPVASATPEASESEPEPEATETASAAEGSAAEPSAIETPALPDGASLLTTTAPEIAIPTPEETESAAATPDQANADTTAEASESAATDAEPATEPAAEVAMATPEPQAEPEAPMLPANANIRVDAVEIEGDRIFVAGSAVPGYPVRVSADGVAIGTEKTDESGRFIVEATSELAVGDHIISADLMDPTGEEILLRATVPFNRPEGESLAAVAPAAAAEVEAEVSEGLVLPDLAGLSKMREDSFEALSSLEKMVSGSEAPDPAQASAAYEDAIAKLKAAAAADLPEGSSDEAMAMAQSMRAQAEAALAALLPPSSEGDGAAMDPATIRDRLKQAETVLSSPAEMAVAAANEADAAASGSGDGQTGEPRTIVQAPLASTPGAVIIRRGDTLWQISRRTYGQGVRYTTIYVANRSQIQDPDRIKPGQVFSVPESPLENAEELHKQLLGGGKQRQGG